ncbi:MAG: 50S ribosomal protein L25 [Chloroflexota bacterium]|nr:MAG: 50S ribosomal protein L25 [Chloroflexota bacterium]
MEDFVLKATKRDVIGKQVKALRRAGKLPAILYGTGFTPTPVVLELRETSRLLAGLHGSALLTVEIDGDSHVALVREKQRNVLTGALTHLDFQVVSMKEKLRVAVTIELVGVAPAVGEFNGILVKGMEEVEVEALPGDLPDTIQVDISRLARIGDAIYVRDLVVPASVEILEDSHEMVVLVTAPTLEVEEEVEEAAVGEPEVIERGKKEEEEEES